MPSGVKEQQRGQLLWEISSPMALQHLYFGSLTKRSREHTAASWRLAQPAGMISASKRPGGPAAFPKGFSPATGCWCRAGKPQHRRQNGREGSGRLQQQEGCRALHFEKGNDEVKARKIPNLLLAKYSVLPLFVPSPF